MVTKNKSQNSTRVKITKNSTYIKHDDGIEIPVSKTWLRQYVEYMLAVNGEIAVEVVL